MFSLNSGSTPLHAAAEGGHAEAVKALLTTITDDELRREVL
eukprot:CAMPEP_0170146808 /NCGR_PEP_ID=MMETSP0033_2-20121228/31940_1 /TAXON_ID=195969 /ORGANISM="Dolichomastix tenuilepis, Strain CCMP3274" /LENGTH=40 /DNA_ID= /DNA_START= /DNA_END= /DNA_ORIENTATION=